MEISKPLSRNRINREATVFCRVTSATTGTRPPHTSSRPPFPRAARADPDRLHSSLSPPLPRSNPQPAAGRASRSDPADGLGPQDPGPAGHRVGGCPLPGAGCGHAAACFCAEDSRRRGRARRPSDPRRTAAGRCRLVRVACALAVAGGVG